MDFLQLIIAVPWFAGGLLLWPAFLIVRGSSDARAPRLRRVFVITFAAVAGIGALLGIIALLGQFNHNWLPVTLLFPVINLISIIFSILELRTDKHAV
jgi:hypothetical protein